MRRYILSAAVILVALLVGLGPRWMNASAQETLSPAQEEAVRALVLETIRENPEIIAEVLQILTQREQAAERERARAALATRADVLFNDPDAPVLGNPDGAVTLVEFMDYQCTYCKAMFPRLRQALDEEDDLKLVIKELPILGPASDVAARAALAARQQDKYADFHGALMELRGRLSEKAVFDTAGKVGLDVERLRRDMEDPAIAAALADNRRLAQELGINGTPAFVTPDGIIPGAFEIETLRQIIAAQRKG